MSKVAAKNVTKPSAAVTPSIPSVERPLSIKEKMALAARKGAKIEVVEPSKGKVKPEIVLDTEALEKAKCWISARVCWHVLDKYVENHKTELVKHLRELYAKTMWDNRSQPENPAVKIRDEQGRTELEMQYITKAVFAVKALELAEGEAPEDAFRNHLIANGMDAGNAAKLVQNELEWPLTTTINFDMDTTDPNSPSVKLFDYLSGTAPVLELDEAGRASLLVMKYGKCQVREGFLERVVLYCSSLKELNIVLSSITPSAFPDKAKAWDTLDPAVRTWNLVETFRKLLPSLNYIDLAEYALRNHLIADGMDADNATTLVHNLVEAFYKLLPTTEKK